MKNKKITIEIILNSPCGHLNKHLLDISKTKGNRAKYKNQKVEYGGKIFDSKKEYKRYRELLLLLKKNLIGQLRTQVKYELIPANEHEKSMSYYADFVYMNMETGEEIVEDAKSEATRKISTYINKRKLMLDKYNIKIKEV